MKTPVNSTYWVKYIHMDRMSKENESSRFKVQGSRFKVQGSRFKVQGSRFK
jgi:hypothetical protein